MKIKITLEIEDSYSAPSVTSDASVRQRLETLMPLFYASRQAVADMEGDRRGTSGGIDLRAGDEIVGTFEWEIDA